MSHLYIGLISGTSMDGIDAALVRFDSSSLEVLHTREESIKRFLDTAPDEMKKQIVAIEERRVESERPHYARY